MVDLEEKHFSPGQTDKYGPMPIPTDIKQQILLAIASIDYGSVEVVVHDGKIVQIECREKIRVGHHQSSRGVIP